jgi:hypothetical protein
MAQNNSMVRVVALLTFSIAVTFAVSILPGRSVSHAGGGCVSSFEHGIVAEAYWGYESQRIGWPLAWLEIITEGCFDARASRPVFHIDGLLLTTAASVLVFWPVQWMAVRVWRAAPTPAV